MYCAENKKDMCQREVIDGCDRCRYAKYTNEEMIETLETQIYLHDSMKQLYNF